MELMIEAPQTSAEIDAAVRRYTKLKERANKNFGYGATDEALHIAQGCYERLAEALSVEMEKPIKAAKGWDEKTLRLLKTIPPHIIALVALNCALRGVIEEEGYTAICERTGEMLRHELFSVQLEVHDKKIKREVEEWVKQKHGNLKYRLQSARSIAKQKGFSFVNRWTPSQHVAVGNFVIDILLVALPDLFEVYYEGDKQMLAVTEGAADKAHDAMQQHVRRYPVFLPSEEPPLPWTDFNKGGPVDPTARKLATLVRTRHRETIVAVKAAVASGQMKPALDALNAVQAVPWKVNAYLMHIMKECKKRGIEVDGLPSNEDLVMPTLEREWDDLSDDEKKAFRMERAEKKKENRILGRDRLKYDDDMETAEVLAGMEQFYIPHNLDWRGREYPLCTFNFQREDRVRALFLFKDGEPIGEEGIQWLKVHVANCGDFGKVSKKSYDERIKWVDDNLAQIMDCAVKDWERGGPLTPEALSFWTKADKPFLFLAACVELTNALTHGPDYVCGLPCSWDGSCSGLQHLCMMTRSEDGWKVNLTDLAEPKDIYQIVADAAQKAMERSSDPLAPIVLAYSGDRRKMFKRNVMTTFYGSKKFGMAQQHMDDLMDPLKREVLVKKRAEHPFGKERKEQHAAARFLAHHACEAIAQEAPLPMKAMELLQDLAALLAHEGKPLEWTTPVGLPWSNRYHEPVTERVILWMHDHGVRRKFRPLVANGHQKDIDKHRAVNGSAPNFVHACDASHLLLTVVRALAEGITQFALVHDSFGSLPSHAARFQGIIRETFVWMYETHDVLTEVLQRAKCDLDEHTDRLLDIVARREELIGNLNIKEVLNAKYAFA
jgi:DNA-directed RNA polymerase, mitochondrial